LISLPHEVLSTKTPFESSLLIITASGTIRASIMCSSSRTSVVLSAPDRFDAEAPSADCSIIMIGLSDEVEHSSFWILREAPDWLGDERFDITAKVPDEKMLQALLIDRFGLVFHHETQIRAGFALVIARNGVKIRPVPDEGGHNNANFSLVRFSIFVRA
jgi:uncharacterized protein (TIGR03435 family)